VGRGRAEDEEAVEKAGEEGVIGTGERVLPPFAPDDDDGISSLIGLLPSFAAEARRSELLPVVLRLVVRSLTRSLAAALGAGGGPFLVVVVLT
jgi:hypothetical protein